MAMASMVLRGLKVEAVILTGKAREKELERRAQKFARLAGKMPIMAALEEARRPTFEAEWWWEMEERCGGDRPA